MNVAPVPKIVILGGGFGGLTLAAELDSLAASGKAEVILIERSQRFSMGFNIQWVLMKRRRPEEGERSYSTLRFPHLKLVQAEIDAIDYANNRVSAGSYKTRYDYLVMALGVEYAPETVPGLPADCINLCDLESIMRFQKALDTISSGTVVIAIASMPFKCPPMPYEYTLLVDDVLTRRGVRDKVSVVVTSPEPHPMPVAGPVVGETFKAMLAVRGVETRFQHKPSKVDAAAKRITYENGLELDYSLLAVVPPHRAPKVVRDTGITNPAGFVPVNLHTMQTSVPNVYAVGDMAALVLPNGKPHPKAGVFAEAQAVAASEQIKARILGTSPAAYTGQGTCFIDVGREMAARGDSYLLEGDEPRVVFHVPSRELLDGKKEFERERLSRWFKK
ncbi:MAG TPA: FAD/NAD(P)-binding oxidoreductase [Candidatus Deferrimicrobium sp.]|nr:FAD/NAD(P)-binding oxidoreductase [Candidatus Deferrimicrobium sp.]